MHNKSLVLAHALLIKENAPLRESKLFVLTNAGLISGTPVWSDEELDNITVIPRSVLQAIYEVTVQKEQGATHAHMLCGDDDVFLLQNATLYNATHTTNMGYLFVRYDSVIGCFIGK